VRYLKMDTCVKCACLAAALIAAGCGRSYRGNPYGVTFSEVEHARQSLCSAAKHDYENGDELVTAAIGNATARQKAAMGMALVDYLSGQWNEEDCNPKIASGRIAALLHQHPGEQAGS
jgi:hypothetical protein